MTGTQVHRYIGKRQHACLPIYLCTCVLVLLAACAPAPAPTLQGTDLQKTPAPDFQLTDASEQPFKLSEQKGCVVVLTFLYTNCPDECPLIAERLREANDKLGKDANGVRFVAVSLDPERD
ncbi:MAG: SCO family protein, partial [Chloroflexi bacterium]|nr:SCO family protein [Chloroflexota bacterium]